MSTQGKRIKFFNLIKLVLVFWNSKLWKTCDMGILLDRHFFAPIQKLESKTGALMAPTDQ